MLRKNISQIDLAKKRLYDVEYNHRVKREVINYYGGCCKCCGEEEIAFLSIDHINGDGAAHRKQTGLSAGTTFYRWLRRSNFPEGFQVLCLNCNRAKHDRGVCPHQIVEESEWVQLTLF